MKICRGKIWVACVALCVTNVNAQSSEFFGSFEDEGKYRIWTFRFGERASEEMASSIRNCGPYAAGIIDQINELSQEEWGMSFAALAAKSVLTFRLHSLAREFKGYPFSFQLRVNRDETIKKVLEYLDKGAGIWRQVALGRKGDVRYR